MKDPVDGQESHDDKDSGDDQERRNKAQIVTKLWESTNQMPLGSDDPWPILRVNQLWVWTINDKKIWVDGFIEYLSKQAESREAQSQPASTEEMMKAMVDYCIGFYERRRQPAESRHHDKQEKGQNDHQRHMLSIRQQFSQYISHVRLNETDLFDNFRKLVKTQQKSTSGIIKLKDQNYGAQMLFMEVIETREELNILKSIAKYQEIVQEKMLGKKHCAELGLTASYVVSDIEEMEKLVEKIHSAVCCPIA
ncbi:unnamed protein product [Clonostachys byssicola]|uniref:Uncharacterized protein n=1 Tax=Clonostachys byssicola TaxID=160290 RepID=A0A9N9Y6V6_9HYPO|nr:unnamed protein product [Clonostachys byssicola]